MRTSNFFNTLIATMAVAVATSCSKTMEIDEETGSGTNGSGSLVVRTAAYATEESEDNDYVNYPVSVYVMDSDGKCLALQEIASASDQLKIELAEGTYDVYAVAGTDNYDLPTANEASGESVLSPKSGKGHGDLMTASSNVTMTNGEENKLTLRLQRRVMQIQSATLTDIPSDVNDVRMSISPLYKGITLNGEYTDGTSSHTFDLVRQADGTTWESSTGEYLLEAAGNVTLKVSLVRDSGTVAYSYASDIRLAANHKVNITGRFVDDEHVTLNGTVMGEDWADDIVLDFDFDRSDITTGGDGGGGSAETLHGDAPEAGTMYNGCYVLRTASEGNATTVTLITPTEKNKIKVSSSSDEETKQQSLKDNTATALDEIAVPGVSGWRLPTQEEAVFIDENATDINARISALGESGVDSIVLRKSGYDCGYFFTASDGSIYVYVLGGNGIDTSPSSGRATYKVRGFATIKFSD